MNIITAYVACGVFPFSSLASSSLPFLSPLHVFLNGMGEYFTWKMNHKHIPEQIILNLYKEIMTKCNMIMLFGGIL